MAIAHYLADMAPEESQRAQLLGATPPQRAHGMCGFPQQRLAELRTNQGACRNP